jgi:hypothetical protein
VRSSTPGATRSPGRRAAAKRSSGGSARSSASSAGGACASTPSSSRTEAASAASSAATAAAVRLSAEIPSARSVERAASTALTRDAAATSRAASPGWVPRAASATRAVSRSPGASEGKARRSPAAPPPSSPAASSRSPPCRLSRVGRSSAPSTWWSCTGTAVCGSGIGRPSSSGALGLPGCRSTKYPPSRNTRGRILAVASACSGRPCSSSAISTTAVVPGPGSTPVTVPTSTPAMRTGEPSRSWLDEAKIARTSWRSANGTCLAQAR